MKRLILFISLIIGLYACNNNKEESISPHEDLQKRIEELFRLNNIDSKGIEIQQIFGIQIEGIQIAGLVIEHHPNYPNNIILYGYKYKNLWLAIFDTETKKLLFEFTDTDKPTSMTAYGNTYEWVYEPIAQHQQLYYGFYLFDDCFSILIPYVTDDESQTWVNWDLISCQKDSYTRYNIIDGYNYIDDVHAMDLVVKASCQEWAYNHILITKGPKLRPNDNIVYDILNNKEVFHYTPSYAKFIVDPQDIKHWLGYTLSPTSLIYANCYADNIGENKIISLFDEYTGDIAYKPQYSQEYIQTESDSHLIKFTKTNYDGTQEVRNVHIYIDDQGGHVQIE